MGIEMGLETVITEGERWEERRSGRGGRRCGICDE